MILFLAAFIFLTITASILVLLIQKKMVWGYRGELLIVLSCLYFVSLFRLAQFLLSGSQ